MYCSRDLETAIHDGGLKKTTDQKSFSKSNVRLSKIIDIVLVHVQPFDYPSFHERSNLMIPLVTIAWVIIKRILDIIRLK